MITVVAAAFSLGKMVRSNELVALMASGVSLKRVIVPIVVLTIIFTAVLVIDQEFLIPQLSDKLTRSQDAVPGREFYNVWFIGDDNGSLVCSQKFDVKTSTLYNPTIILRKPSSINTALPVWKISGRIIADKAVYNPLTGKWDLVNGRLIEKDMENTVRTAISYTSDLTPRDIPIRRKSANKTLLSWRQLAALAGQGAKVKDIAQLYSQMHFHITDPLINLVMLMVSLPVLVCRDPKSMKSAILISFSTTGACFIVTFICKMLAAEVIWIRMMPEFWAWLPVFIFLPIAFVELDSMKT
jgi:lipopolysaccharide export LptBFGC system permease protein LptF